MLFFKFNLLKMKNYIFLLIVFIFISCASSQKATEEQMKHEYIKEFTGISKDEIFDRSMRWITQNFKSAKSVVDYEDKSAGTIVAKGIIPDIDLGGVFNANLGFTLTIDIKDGKARFKYDNLIPIDPNSGQEVPKMTSYERVHIKANKEFDKLTEEIYKTINTKTDF